MPKVTNLDQRVELIAADVEDIKANGLGPEPIDAYTKTEADLKFQTIAGMSAYQTTAGMSSYLTTANAALIYQPIGSYLTASDIADMATQTWVGSQGFLTSSDVDEVPSVGSSDNGKVLTAVYNDGAASYSWQTPQVVSYTKAEADAKFQTITGMSSYLTSSDAASTYQPIGSYATTSDISDMATQTWVGSQSYLTQSAASSTYLTQSDASTTYLPSATARQVPAPVAADDGKVLTAASNGTYSWETASSGGGLSVETDGTNYWITVNGVRLYFASSAPTGTIPDGSMGIGW